MDRSDVEQWVGAYERVWRTAGTDQLVELFTEDISYLPSPWARPLTGLDRLAQFWERERAGPDEQFTMVSDVVALDEDTAVVRLAVDYLGTVGTLGAVGAVGTVGTELARWRDLWVLRFAADGRCAEFEEWPFAPSSRDGHQGSP